MTTIYEVAAELAGLVENNLPPSPGVATRDTNDELLCVAYGRAYRCFQSIRELAERHEADDALVLTRTLLFIALHSLYIALPDDPSERQKRHRSSGLTSMKAELTAKADQAAAGFDVSGYDLERVERIVDHLEQEGVPRLPPLEQIAKAVGFGPFYPRVFRPTSAVAHYSIWSALDGYIELGVPSVSLDLPGPSEHRRHSNSGRSSTAHSSKRATRLSSTGSARPLTSSWTSTWKSTIADWSANVWASIRPSCASGRSDPRRRKPRARGVFR